MDKPNFDTQFIGEAVRLLSNVVKINEWALIADNYGFSEVGYKTYGFRDINTFRPEEQIKIIYEFVKKAYNIQPKLTIFMLKKEIQKNIKSNAIQTSELEEYMFINNYLNDEEIDLTLFSDKRYLDITGVHDPFYIDLINSINKTHRYRIYTATILLVRKLIENLVIEILRKKFRSEIYLYYIPNSGRFQNFNTLIDNFKDRLTEYKVIIPSLDNQFIMKLNKFRLIANASAHSLETNMSADFFEQNKDDLLYVVKILIRLSNQL